LTFSHHSILHVATRQTVLDQPNTIVSSEEEYLIRAVSSMDAPTNHQTTKK
jgi:hypothetical protein